MLARKPRAVVEGFDVFEDHVLDRVLLEAAG